MRFADVIGQDRIKAHLVETIQSGRTAHAQLFLGPQGCGALPLALAYAQFLLCENKTENDSCGTCRSCVKVSKHVHPDVHYSYPTVGSKMISTNFLKEWRELLTETAYFGLNTWLNKLNAENKTGNITKDECLDIIKKLSFKTFEAEYKVLILWLPEFLQKEGNRLLKLIEEPPENTVFVLVAENQELILNTILSRCQLVKINALADEDVTEALLEQVNGDRDKAESLARLADGNFAKAIELSHEVENDNAKLFLDWMRICYKGHGREIVDWVDKISGAVAVEDRRYGRKDQQHFLQYAFHFLREYAFLKSTQSENIRLKTNELATAQNLTKVIEMDQVERINSLLNDCAFYIERNAHSKILFLDTSIQMHKILRRKAL